MTGRGTLWQRDLVVCAWGCCHCPLEVRQTVWAPGTSSHPSSRCSDLGQRGVGIGLLLLDGGPEAVSPFEWQPPGPVVQEQSKSCGHRSKQAQAQAQDGGQLGTPGGFCGGCGGLPGGPGPGSSGLGGGVPVWGALGLPGWCVWGGPVLTDGVGTPVGWPQCALSCQGAADGQGAGQARAPTPPLSVDNAWEFSSGPPRNLSLGRTPVASCRSPGHAAPHMGSFWSTCTLTM